MVGVVIARFQVPQLTLGHRALLDAAQGEGKLLVLLGVRQGQPTTHDPLDYLTRAEMVRAAYPLAIIRPVLDHPSDVEWSRSVDALCAKVFPYDDATLYAGRDSFAQHYTGRWPVKLCATVLSPTGTEQRAQVMVSGSPLFREGVIYGTRQRFPTSYQAVDLAITKERTLLVGRKSTDTQYVRLPGGFVDPTDRSLEAACWREMREEVGDIEVSPWQYVASFRIPDWRYRASPDKVCSALFRAEFIFGPVRAGDDLCDAFFLPFDEVREKMDPVHQPLLAKFLETV